jgi:hypothetical protein
MLIRSRMGVGADGPCAMVPRAAGDAHTARHGQVTARAWHGADLGHTMITYRTRILISSVTSDGRLPD